MALFQKESGTRFALVPYRGFPAEMQDLVAGRIDFAFDTSVQLPFTRAGNIKAYAVTNDARLAQAPDIPTFSEMGLPSVSGSGWTALFAPKNVPKEIVGKLNAAFVEALADQGLRSRLAELGHEVYPRERQTPEALGALRRPMPRNGGRSSRSLGSSPSEPRLGHPFASQARRNAALPFVGGIGPLAIGPWALLRPLWRARQTGGGAPCLLTDTNSCL